MIEHWSMLSIMLVLTLSNSQMTRVSEDIVIGEFSIS